MRATSKNTKNKLETSKSSTLVGRDRKVNKTHQSEAFSATEDAGHGDERAKTTAPRQ